MNTDTLIAEFRKLPPDEKQAFKALVLADEPPASSVGQSNGAQPSVMELAGCLRSDVQFTSFQDEKEAACGWMG